MGSMQQQRTVGVVACPGHVLAPTCPLPLDGTRVSAAVTPFGVVVDAVLAGAAAPPPRGAPV